jgi:hypothetical protein
MICKCAKCERQFDSKEQGYVMLKPEDTVSYSHKAYCENCFTEEFQCEECGGFKNKFAMAVYDGSFCECD